MEHGTLGFLKSSLGLFFLIFIYSGEEQNTKYGIAKLMGEIFQLDTSHITPNPDPPGPNSVARPCNCKLDTTALQIMGLVELRPFKDGLLGINTCEK